MCDCKSFDECVCSVSTSCCCLSLLLLLLLLLGRLVSFSGHVLGEGSAGCQGVAESYLDSKSGGSLRGMGKGGEGEEDSISKSHPHNPNNPDLSRTSMIHAHDQVVRYTSHGATYHGLYPGSYWQQTYAPRSSKRMLWTVR